jgi:hypothetical protein
MNSVTYTNYEGLTNTIEFPMATRYEDEPLMEGFEAIARAAAHEADLVIIEDWLGEELAA